MSSVFYLGFSRERIKRHFLVPNSTAGNITWCHEQHVVRELPVVRAYRSLSCGNHFLFFQLCGLKI